MVIFLTDFSVYLISDAWFFHCRCDFPGCELLVLLYGPGIIGSLVIPILGALPDSLIILLSGLGSGTKQEIQGQLSVGVGTLVGRYNL